uniref:Glutathione S-transferase D1 n=1 Tax=Bemisia tabaci TaxID=7038 RepID=A0A6C0MCC1_BEMTA|nr:glutathione S-transferase D1 [Bemisia tabaci]
MTAKLIGIYQNLDLIEITDMKTPEFQKINPFKRIPVLDDNGFLLSESRAINAYLCNEYGKDDSLYPRNSQRRAIVDQMLDFDLGTLNHPIMDYWYHCILKNNPHDEVRYQKMFNPLKKFNEVLDSYDFAAGMTFTIADVSLLASISSVDALGIGLTKYPHILRWFNQSREIVPDYNQINHTGILQIKELIGQWKGSFGHEFS